jgi:hypothetical protein
LRVKLGQIISILPGNTGRIPCSVRVGDPGPFSHSIRIYIDDGRWLREVKIGVKGVAKARPPLLF